LADDLVQDACLKAWSCADTFDAAQPMRPWIFRILRNEYYMMLRRAWRTVNVEPEFAEAALVQNGDQEVRQDFIRMEQIIYSLPDAQRDALLLVLAAGLTYEEAALVCRCSAGTVKSRVSRAREAVIARFESQESTLRCIKGGAPQHLSDLLDQIDLFADQRAVA
ncbi:MAG: sigma-70 family RNA polymerase sigma factor, partial [Henriciella sp.]|uniref:sigma-70 family RNA polymerase sigma factor n=1 Tax=Henriciella sp. TaxID=1968823 RepID=UPI003C761215